MNSLHIVCFAACMVFCMAGQCHDPIDKRVYTFAFGNDFKPYEFINDKGELVGFYYDIVKRVCEVACKKCAYIVYNDYANCMSSKTLNGYGLNNRYFDVCAGWVTTAQRELSYSFSEPFSNERPSALFAKSSSGIRKFNPDTHKIGIREGFRTNEACLKLRHGWNVQKVTYYPNWKTILDKVVDGTIDVGFVDEVDASYVNGLRKITDSMTCAKKGPSIMTRKDIAPDYEWFGETLKEVKASPYYKWMCNIAKLAYGSDVMCTV